MNTEEWERGFNEVYQRGLAAGRIGRRSPETMFAANDATFLRTIGCTTQELFDFVDDFLNDGEPDYETALKVTALRRDYFLNVLGGRSSGRVASMAGLPSKSAAVDGMVWLPRLIAKARLKLCGEMPADLMYGCGGDRSFMRRMRLNLPDFLKLVRDSGDDDRRIIDAVKKSAAQV